MDEVYILMQIDLLDGHMSIKQMMEEFIKLVGQEFYTKKLI